MAKSHMFDVALAEKYGPVESILLSHLCFWIEKNQHNQKNFYKGRYWVYNSAAAFERIFTYLNKDQIRRVLDKLNKQGALYVDNFNKIGYDRTLWYSVSDAVMDIYTAGKGNRRDPPSAQMGNVAQTGKWGKNGGKTADLTEIEAFEPCLPETACPNGQMHIANSQNAIAQTGNNAQSGKWGENEACPPENACPNRQMHIANPQDRSRENATSIPQIRKIDSAEPQDRSGGNAAPIPDINIYKPSSDSKTAEKEFYFKLFLGIDPRFVFSDDFYETARKVFAEYEFDENYCRWLYRYCLDRETDNIRGLYYTLFDKPEMLQLYLSAGKNNTKYSPAQCPACDASFNGNLPMCPSCKLAMDDFNNESAVKRHKRYLALSSEQKSRYDDDLSSLVKKLGSIPMPQYLNEIRNIEIRYGLILAADGGQTG